MAKINWLFRAENIRYSVPGRKHFILNVNSISVEKGKCYFILGENGAGKSSLLSVLGGQLSPDSGELFWNENRIRPLSERVVKGFEGVGVVKQEPELNQFLKTEEELYKALRHLPDRDLHRKKSELIRLCHLKTLFGQKVGNLSGGEKRRLAIALALAQNVELLLLDEPFSDLDYPNKALFRAMLLRLKQNRDTALVVVSHHGEDAYWLADQILTLEKGRWIEKMNRSTSSFMPKSVRTARLMGWKNLLPTALLGNVQKGASWFHCPENSIQFYPDYQGIGIGEAEIVLYHFKNEKWHLLLEINGFLLEAVQNTPPDQTKIQLYVKTDALLYLKN